MNNTAALKNVFDLDAVFEVDDYLYVYGADLTDERSDSEVASVVRLLDLDSPLSLLDAACGFGRHTNRLAALGHRVTGVDITPGFIDMARQQAAQMGVAADYRVGDMRQLDFVEQFDRVMLLFTSFGYFDDAQNIQVAANLARALKPGGLLALDLPNRDAMASDPPASDVIERDDGLIINRMSFDVLSGRFCNRRIVIRNGVRKDKPFSIRLYNAQEIRDLLVGVGLEICQFFGDDEQSLSPRSRRMIVIARKPQ